MSSEVKIESTLVDIYPNGDVVLIVGQGDEKTRLRVSSHALSCVSPVFKRMLSSNFVEGLPTTQSTTRNIELPEDDVTAITTLCNIAHMRSKSVNLVSFRALECLSIICDKYDAVEALMPWTSHWMNHDFAYHFLRVPRCRFLHEKSEHIAESLYVAYGYGSNDGFASATWTFIRMMTRSSMSQIDGRSRGFAILPEGFLGEYLLNPVSQLLISLV